MTQLARRFYQNASATPERGVALDARTLRTPGGTVFVAPTAALAEAVAEEWSAQGEYITPGTMPITQLAFASIDHAARRRTELVEYVAKFGETDLVCHRADSPPDLVARQSALWDPLVAWSQRDLGVLLPVVTGVLAAPVQTETLETLRAHAAALDDFQLTALSQAAGLAGSALIAFAMLHGKLGPKSAFEAAALDNLYSLEKWGDDAEARAKLDRQRTEFENVARFIAALGG